MSNTTKIFEKDLYNIWKNKKFESELETLNGDEIFVLDSGIENDDTAGPDFINARIRIGNLTFVGDIEIDSDYTDWKSHGHNINNKYNKVVLHASLTNKFNQPYVYTKDGRKVPSIKLCDFIDNNEVETIETKIQSYKQRHQHSLRCEDCNSNLDMEFKEKYVASLGIERFKKKCKKFYDRLKELKYINELHLKEPVISYELSEDFNSREFAYKDFQDKELWQQLLYEYLFEALGYSKNKSIMLKLSQSVNINFIKKFEKENNFIELLESALFNISGLMPESERNSGQQSSDYTKNLVENWEKLKHLYDGYTYNEADWNYFKLRPQNFPTIRIAGGSRFLKNIIHDDLIAVMVKKINEIRNLTVLTNSLRSLFVVQSEGFWQEHFVFDKPAKMQIKYFVGASRADEILTNVILPYFAVYFDIFGNKDLSKKILSLYSMYEQRSDNKIVREVAENLDMVDHLKKTVYNQGMIELFRHYCSKSKCMECEIGKMVFN